MLLSCFRLTSLVRKGVTKECFLAPVLLLLLLLFSSLHVATTILTHVVLLPLSLWLQQRFWPKVRFSRFFPCWTLCSFLLLVTVFEFEVVPFLEILVFENGLLLTLTGLSVVLAAVVRSRSPSSSAAAVLLTPDLFRRHYCSCLESVITSRNRGCFVACLLCTICALLYSTHLILGTICHPVLVADWILLPDDCSDVYSDVL